MLPTGMVDWHFWLVLGAIIVLLVLSAFFVAAETALSAASKARMHQLEQEGDRRAGLVNHLRGRHDQVTAVLLLGKGGVNTVAVALATAAAVQICGNIGILYAVAALTAAVVIFAGILPKTYALNHADRVALAVAPFVALVIWFLRPPAAMLLALAASLLRPARSQAVDTVGEAAEEELRGAIELHRGDPGETVEEARHERAMLRSILDLNTVEVSEIMTHRNNLVTVDAGQPVGKVVDEVLASPFTRLPLWKDNPDNIVGVIHAKALAREVRAHAQMDGLDIVSLASRPWFVPDSTTLLDQLQAFRERREHFALVVDEYGSLLGVVTLEDILEEIVGDIVDEMDVQVAGVRQQPNGTYIVDGWVTIRDLNREFEWRLPDEEASTLAGLVLYEARVIPEVGQSFVFYGFRFDILRRQRHQITAIRVTPPPGSPRDVSN